MRGVRRAVGQCVAAHIRGESVILVGTSCILLMMLDVSPVIRVGLALLPVILVAGSAAFMVLGYELRGQALLIKRPGWTTRIPLAGLRAVEIDPKALTRSIRVFGNGGLFAFSGLFWSKNLGRFRAYVTDLDRSVVLRLANRTIVVSPHAPEDFAVELRQRGLVATMSNE